MQPRETEPILILTDDEQATLNQATASLKTQLRSKSRDDFACFGHSVLKDERLRERIRFAPHQLEWFDHVERCKEAGLYTGILAPPESGKSQVWAIGFPLFMAGNDSSIRCIICAATKGIAKNRTRATKEYLEKDEDLHAIFPDLKPDQPEKWTEQEFTINRPHGIKDPTYGAYGITKPPQGGRVDVLIGDDVCDYDNTISEPAMRPKVIELWENGFDTRISPQSLVIYIGGIIHNQDLTSRLLTDKRFWFIKQSINRTFDGITQEDLRTGEIKHLPLWKRAWTTKFLRAKFESNPRAFERAYRHHGYSDEERTFSDEAINKSICAPYTIPRIAPRFIGVDLSAKRRAGNVIFIIALLENDKRVVLDVQRGAWSSDETARRIIQANTDYTPTAIVVENNAYQGALIDWLKAVSPVILPIEPFTTGKQKADEVLGIPGLSAEFENQMWDIPFEDGHRSDFGCNCGKCILVRELKEHPFGNSDTVMGAWFARFAAMKHRYKSEVEISLGRKIGKGNIRTQNRGGGRLSAFRKSRLPTK